MFQYYVLEIQKYNDGTYGHLVHYVADADPDRARQKGDAKYYEVLAAAALSELPQHSAILVASDGFPVMHGCYQHNVTPAAGE